MKRSSSNAGLWVVVVILVLVLLAGLGGLAWWLREKWGAWDSTGIAVGSVLGGIAAMFKKKPAEPVPYDSNVGGRL